MTEQPEMTEATPGQSVTLSDELGDEFNKWGKQVYGDKWPRINRIDLLEYGFKNGYRKALGRPISTYPIDDSIGFANAAKEALYALAQSLEEKGKLYGANQVRILAAQAKQWGYCA
jgi:hypothetical protein